MSDMTSNSTAVTAKTLAGKPAAEAILQNATERAQRLSVTPHLALVRVGEDPASVSYVRSKEQKAKAIGLSSDVHVLPVSASKSEVLQLISRLNSEDTVHGILVQLPLPQALQPYENEILQNIDPCKDVDGLHPVNVGRLWSSQEGLRPCTPAGVISMLQFYGIELAGKNVVIIGRSQLVGRPLAALILEQNATVTIAHSRSTDLAAITREADVLCVAVGKAHLVTPDMVKEGAVVVDVGINEHPDPQALNSKGRRRLTGDVDPAVSQVAAALTPVPGGVGLLTVAQLLANTVTAAEHQQAATQQQHQE